MPLNDSYLIRAFLPYFLRKTKIVFKRHQYIHLTEVKIILKVMTSL